MNLRRRGRHALKHLRRHVHAVCHAMKREKNIVKVYVALPGHESESVTKGEVVAERATRRKSERGRQAEEERSQVVNAHEASPARVEERPRNLEREELLLRAIAQLLVLAEELVHDDEHEELQHDDDNDEVEGEPVDVSPPATAEPRVDRVP